MCHSHTYQIENAQNRLLGSPTAVRNNLDDRN